MSSNSRLATLTIKSPNHSGTRVHHVTRISPHCMVGQLSAKQCGEIFSRASYQASSNYGIGTDGEIGLYVDEANRSWCTSSADNDNRAITIECASDTKAPYKVNDKVWDSLRKLCVDICLRYSKKKLLWFNDKKTSLNYKPKDDEMVLTVHRWFAAKSCPGDYLYSRMGTLAEEVTSDLACMGLVSNEKVVENPATAAVVVINNEESDRAKKIWDFFISKGLNQYATAGLIGNLYFESALRPNNLQNSFEKKLGMTDKSYTTAVNTGTYDNFIHDGAGYGLAQWTFWSRKKALLKYANSINASIDNLEMQLDFLWSELQHYEKVMSALDNATSVRQAAVAVLTGYEKPADQGAGAKSKRTKLAQEYYDKFVNKNSDDKGTATKFYIQFGAFSSKQNAKKRLEEVKNSGINAVMFKFDGYFRVIRGYYDTMDEACSDISEARKAGWKVVIKERKVSDK